MSGCERALDLIGLRLDGPLSPEEQRELDAHLEQCPACRAAARELEELEGALVQLGECDPQPQLVSGVMERVRADSAPAKVVPLWKRPAFRGALGMAAMDHCTRSFMVYSRHGAIYLRLAAFTRLILAPSNPA